MFDVQNEPFAVQRVQLADISSLPSPREHTRPNPCRLPALTGARGLSSTLPLCMRGPAEARLTEEWQSADPARWEDHMPLSTPAGCVGGGLASPRIGPESRAGLG